MPPISFEFFPPKTHEALQRLQQHCKLLAGFAPQFFSVTYGAGGSTREGTWLTVQTLRDQGHNACPHLSCIGASKALMEELLEQYLSLGIERVVVLRGDMPSGSFAMGDFRHASDLVQFIRDRVGQQLHLEVAAYPEYHPQCRSPNDDFEALVHKFAVGANSAITQFFYNPDSYEAMLNRLQQRGIDAPIVPGIMPINNFVQLDRFAQNCGAEIPRWIRQRLAHYGDDIESIRQYGIEVVTNLCQKLLNLGAPGLHFYTLNNSTASSAILRNLNSHPEPGIKSSA